MEIPIWMYAWLASDKITHVCETHYYTDHSPLSKVPLIVLHSNSKLSSSLSCTNVEAKSGCDMSSIRSRSMRITRPVWLLQVMPLHWQQSSPPATPPQSPKTEEEYFFICSRALLSSSWQRGSSPAHPWLLPVQEATATTVTRAIMEMFTTISTTAPRVAVGNAAPPPRPIVCQLSSL